MLNVPTICSTRHREVTELVHLGERRVLHGGEPELQVRAVEHVLEVCERARSMIGARLGGELLG